MAQTMIIILSKKKKYLVKRFEGKLEYLGKNTEKYKKFSVPLEKEITKIDKDGNENIVIISYK